MATLSQPVRPTIHDSSSPSNTRHLKNLGAPDVSSPRSSLSDRHPPDLPPPPPPVALPTATASATASATATATATATGPVYSHRHTASVSRLNQRTTSGIFAFAAAALDRTQIAFANISEPSIRPRASNGALSRLSLLASPSSEPASPERVHKLRSSSNQSLLSNYNSDGKLAQSATANNPPSQPYSATDPNRPQPIRFPSSSSNKMHQTSSRLLRMTDDERPFTKVRRSGFAGATGPFSSGRARCATLCTQRDHF